jgi:chemotaxis protein CheY-P-specific phosphatase CheC
MQNEYKTVLADVFTNTLMRYAFMFGEVSPKSSLPENGGNYLHVTVNYNGNNSGIVGLSSSVDLCYQLAENVLGMDPNDEETMDLAFDTLKELANIVCGRYLTSAYGKERVFQLSPPSVSEMNKKEWNELAKREETVGFTIDDIPVLIYVIGDTR